MYAKLKALTAALVGKVTALRHNLHQLAEPAFAEVASSALISDTLRDLGLNVSSGIAGTGIVADIGAGDPDKGYVVLRADMDALPLQEQSQLPYRSTNAGYCHACGHDGHSATLVGVAMVLSQMQADIGGCVRLMFQPAEEIAQGARAMLEAGAIGSQQPQAILTLHAWPGLSEATVAARVGTMTASNDSFTVTFYGQGGHGAPPALVRSPLPGMARLIEAAEQMHHPQSVVSICVAQAGSKDNIIPDLGMVAGTVRGLCESSRNAALAELRGAIATAAANSKLEAKLLLQQSCPTVTNDPDLFKLFLHVGEQLRDCLHTEILPEPSMGSEDFGCLAAAAPLFMFRVGMGTHSAQLHTPKFDYHDGALETGMLMLAGMALEIAGTAKSRWHDRQRPTSAPDC